MQPNLDSPHPPARVSPSGRSPRKKANSTASSGKVRAENVIKFIERLIVPSGEGHGEPFDLLPFQKQFIHDIYGPRNKDGRRKVRRAILSMGRKNGKGLSLNTLIPTPRGFTTMGALKVGDELFDERGQVCRVTFKSPVHIGLRCWQLRFADGTSVVADEQHQWLTTHRFRPWQTSGRQVRNGHGRRSRTAIVTTPQIAESLHLERNDDVREHNHKIAVAKAVECPPADLPIPPYVLGYWLGNGNTNSATITIGRQDEERVVEEIERELGYELTARKVVGDRHPQYGLTHQSLGRATNNATKLRALGVIGDKHIPEIYKWASREQRLALLQGLMDSDGTASGGNKKAPRCCFDVMNETLARDALFLVRSLGLKATIREDVAKIDGRPIGPCWSVSFTAYREDRVFRLQRRAANLVPRRTKARSNSNAIVACDPVPSVPTQCIQVDSPSRLFLVGEGFTPTHNTALIAALVLVHLIGPEARPNGEIYSAANDRDQAAIVFKFARQIVEGDPELAQYVKVVGSTKTILGLRTASVYRAISAEAGTKHGYSPSLVIYDELARAKTRELYDVLDTSMGAQPEPLFVVISTQSNDPDQILSKLIDDGLGARDPTIVCHLYEVPEDCKDIYDPKVWVLANPALDKFRSLADLKATADKAARMPAEEPKFRNLYLNQRVAPVSSLISRAEWMACAGPAEFVVREQVYLALDMSAVVDLTALVMGSAENDRTRVQAFMWKPEDLLKEHSDRDFGAGNARYVQWHSDGHLLTSPGRSINPAVIAMKIAELTQQYHVLGLAYDRWRIADLLREFDRIGLHAYEDKETEQRSKATIAGPGVYRSGLRLVPWGQGFRDMGPAIDALEIEIVERKLEHPSNPLLTWTMANAVATMDPAGNRKIDKDKARFRIDGAVALTMMCGLKSRDRKKDHGAALNKAILERAGFA